MFRKDPILIKGPLGRIYAFTLRYQGNNLFDGPRLAFPHDRAYARDYLLQLARGAADDPFNYRLLDVWQLVFQKPWTRPASLFELVSDLTAKIHRGELFVYLEPDPYRIDPDLLASGPPQGDPPFLEIGSLRSGSSTDTPRTTGPIISQNDGEPRDAPLTKTVPQTAPEPVESSLDRGHLYRTVGLDTVTAKGGGGETIGAMYDKVYDGNGNQRSAIDNDTASAFDEAYLQAQEISDMRAEAYEMAVKDAAIGAAIGPVGLGASKLGGNLYRKVLARLSSKLSTFPVDPHEMTRILGVEPKRISTTPDGTQRIVWEPNSNTRIRFESHPHGLSPADPGFNPRHHGEHFHVEIKPDGISWNKANKQNLVMKVKPENYTPGSGTGFVAGEKFPGL